jgi:hypothetical protein
MPMFHFNSRTGGVVLADLEGEELPNIGNGRAAFIPVCIRGSTAIERRSDSRKPAPASRQTGKPFCPRYPKAHLRGTGTIEKAARRWQLFALAERNCRQKSLAR